MEVGFNQSNLFTIEGQTEATNVCVEVISGTLERNISVYLETVGGDGEGNNVLRAIYYGYENVIV